ncbi:kinetochore scaffold 1 [Clinocottus analis]|uniref:kinetochore scaffold 1 n=1 Tax=Clinocottus analis TaxID=304258 RepID=UPI0035C0DA1D
MEPLDPPNNDEGSGFSRRRISSILKAPRRSVHFPEPQQEKKVVECAKPVEKRASRRVSFAPANDVLLFSKDVKSASPAQSPSQDLITTTATDTQYGVQVEVTEDGIQQIMGMETLLNAPLHTSQQRDNADFDTGRDLGEKTLMFSSDDAFMDMTHCHTINIAYDPDISLQNYDYTRGEKRVMHTANNGAINMTPSHNENIGSVSVPTSINMDLKVEKRTISSSAHTLDPGFENFLASLSKPRDPRVNPVITTMTPTASTERANCSVGQIKTHRADVGKENQAPTLVSAVMEKSLGTSRKIGELSYGNALCPEEDLSMDMTEAQTGHIVASSEDDDPFQCLFPTQEMYSRLDSRMSLTKEKTKQQQISKPQASLNPKDMILKNPSLQDFNQRHKDNLDTADECREKTIMFTAGDEIVDMTQSHTIKIDVDSFAPSNQNASMNLTGSIIGLPGSVEPFQFNFPTKDMYPKGSLKKQEVTARPQHNEALESSPRKGMDTTLNASLNKKVQKHQVKFDAEDDCREKTVRFSADDACMDMTRSHTVNIEPNLQLQSHQNVDFLPARGEKTVRFSADDACMDMTRSHTVNIEPDLQLQSHQNVDFLPACGEKTVRFSADDACMDMTRSHTVNIEPDLQLHSQKNVDLLPACGEKTVRFSADDACMDMTRSHTVNIEPDLQLQSHQNVDFLPACGEKTVRFTAADDCMDVTQALTVKIDHYSASDTLPHQDSDISSTHENCLSAEKTHLQWRNQSLSASALDPGLKISQSKISGPWANPVITRAAALTALSPQKTEDTNGFLDQVKTRKPNVEIEQQAPAFVSSAVKKPINEAMMEGPEPDVSMEMTESQTCYISGQTDEPPQCPSSTMDLSPNSDLLKKTEVTSQLSLEELGLSNPDDVGITNLPDSLPSNETATSCKPQNQTLNLLAEAENSPSAVNHDVDAAPSRKSRRISLVDLQSKVRRLSHIINTSPVTIAVEACTAPLPQLEHDVDKNSTDKTKCPPVTEPELVMGVVNTEENTHDQSLVQGEQPTTTTSTTTAIPTPSILKTKQLMSRLSVGNFKAKLPQRGKDPKKQTSVEEQTTATVNVTNKLNNFDNDLDNIFDEELAVYEDMSETLDMSPRRATEEVSASYVLEDNVFEEDFVGSVNGKKRPLLADENNMDEKRTKTSTEAPTDVETSHVVESLQTTQTTDYSNSIHTSSTRCEATFESTFKQSLFESQLEDYTNDLQRKLNDGNITVSEFLKLFNIDFVIHNPRQSILPGRRLSDTDHTPMDLLKDRHIYRPKQMVYETDVLNLTEHVERLKGRMQDLNKPLKIVNRPLWEEVRNSSEKELKLFGAKLKERNNLFRKLSKVQSHEMKEVLYSNIVQASLEEQQRLRGTIGEADEMLKCLDDCIHELETDLNAVEEKGFKDKPSLKSRLEEMQKVAEVLADNDRQISELEIQKKHNSNKLNRLKAETRNLESHVDVLHRVNEWRFAEKTDNCTTYTFLHETMHLKLVYEESSGNDAGNQSERKISHISFKFQLDDEKSQGHAFFVHKLLSEYFKGESDWVEKYPTSRHVPTLLHDVGLVVSRCRLLGEELRLMKMWGGLRLDILNISCVDTQVYIVFSSLKAFSKFEVIFSVGLIDRLCVFGVQHFTNIIGNTTIQQIEEIVASFSPTKNLLTKIVKKIHDNLLC